MKANLSLAFAAFSLFSSATISRAATTTEADGDWSLQNITLDHTSEAERMVRTGDIDNLGFGWPAGFNPFSGNRTPAHSFPWTPRDEDASGTDRILVISSFDRTISGDGYSRDTSRSANAVRPITLTFPVNDLTVTAATLQLFVDDFQSPVFGSNYQVTLNGKRVPAFEAVINNLVQTGPIGNLITLPIPPELLDEVRSGSVALIFDDFTTRAGDGYAIDFAKLLINPTGSSTFTGTVRGKVTNAAGQPLAGILVSAGNVQAVSSATGVYTLTGVPAGSSIIQGGAEGYNPQSRQAAIYDGQSTTLDFVLGPAGTALPESTGIAGMPWRSGGNAVWTGQPEAGSALPVAAAGQIGDAEFSWMETTFSGPGKLTFSWRISSETASGSLALAVRGEQDGILYGTTAWATRTITLPPGPTLVRWTYRKNGSRYDGVNGGWVKDLSFTPSTYAEASASAGLNGAAAEPDATPFPDGLPNLLKYAFNLDLSRPSFQRLNPGAGDLAGLPVITSTASGDTVTLRVEFIRRRNSGLTYLPALSNSLGDGVAWAALPGTPEVTAIDPFWERVIYTRPVNSVANPTSFIRVEVEGP